MEGFKRYLPWIIGGAILLFILSRLSSRTTKLAPQTQFVESQQVDQFAESRASAFEGLLQVVGLQIGEDAETERARIAGTLEAGRARIGEKVTSRAQEIERELGLRALDVDLSRINVLARAAERSAEFDYLSRENDRQIQQSAIDRYYSSRNTGNIVSSVTQALSSIFSNRGSGGVFTPPTFPRGGLF